MTANTSITIAASKAKLAKLFLISLLFVGGGLWLVLYNPQTGNSVFNNTLVKAIVGYLAILLGLFGLYFYGRKWLDKKPGLVIDEQGIYDNTSALYCGLVPWSDITRIYESTVRTSLASKERFVTVQLTDPNKYITREKNFLKRKLLQANANSYGSPIQISANSLDIQHAALLQLLLDAFAAYKQTG